VGILPSAPSPFAPYGKITGKSERSLQMADIFEKVAKIIEEQLNISKDEIKLDSKFVEDLGADSLDIVELMMSLEEQFGIEIPDSEAEKMQTVGDVVEYIKSKLEG
jgi:acyl carrier protein